MIPKEGTDLWVDTMVITSASENKDAALSSSSTTSSSEDTGKWVVENIMYKVPNKAAMESVEKTMFEAYPNFAITPTDLLKGEQLRDLGKAQKAYTKAVSEITASK